MVKLPYVAMAYVDNNTKELLVTTSDGGENWSPGHRIVLSSKMAPALATFYPRSS
jgi:hypothetical protein